MSFKPRYMTDEERKKTVRVMVITIIIGIVLLGLFYYLGR
jgi:hypothetical protein